MAGGANGAAEYATKTGVDEMENIFAPKNSHNSFSWASLGDIQQGRGELGEEMPVLVYRLMQFTMLDVMSRDMGEEKANTYFRRAGHLAGMEFAKFMLNLNLEFDSFITSLQSKMRDLKIGILRMERFDPKTGEILLSVGEDLDCSGLPITEEVVCVYDEGFIAGILEAYTGKPYNVLEVDCWANGARVCRFEGKVQK